MRNRHRQRGLTMTGFLFTAIVAVTVVMIAFRVMPPYIEYYTVKKIMAKTLEDSKQGFSLYQFRKDFDLKASADYIDSVQGTDIQVAKEGNTLVATANWTRTLHLIGNASLLLEFEATATK